MLPRRVQAELLDDLPAADPVAVHSRRDLRRVHLFLATRARLVRALSGLVTAPERPLRVLELGAGDGLLLLGVAREMDSKWGPVELTLLDRVALVDRATVAAFARCGWTARSSVMDVRDWARAAGDCRPPAASRWDVVVANLFLHHFEGKELKRLLAAIAARSEHFIALEPRRGWRALAGSHLVGLLGANAVTRTDAVLSVHAGFRDRELTTLWPNPAQWTVREEPAGAFGHCFRATRRRTP